MQRQDLTNHLLDLDPQPLLSYTGVRSDQPLPQRVRQSAAVIEVAVCDALFADMTAAQAAPLPLLLTSPVKKLTVSLELKSLSSASRTR